MIQYKVWINVEHHDDDNNEYYDVGIPDCLSTFEKLKDANYLVASLLNIHAPQNMAYSDHCQEYLNKQGN